MKSCILGGIFLSALILLSSCSPKISVVLSSSGQSHTDVYCTIPAVLSNLMESFTGNDVRSLISPADIRRNLAASSIPTISCTITPDNEFILKTGSINPLILPIPVETSPKAITVTFSPEAMQNIVGLLPPETADTFDLLLAPVLTGEKMTSEEYIDLIAAVYGASVATELEKSQLSLTFETPSPASLTVTKQGKSQTVSSNSQNLSQLFSVAGVLTLQEPVTLKITW